MSSADSNHSAQHRRSCKSQGQGQWCKLHIDIAMSRDCRRVLAEAENAILSLLYQGGVVTVNSYEVSSLSCQYGAATWTSEVRGKLLFSVNQTMYYQVWGSSVKDSFWIVICLAFKMDARSAAQLLPDTDGIHYKARGEIGRTNEHVVGLGTREETGCYPYRDRC